jgi:hypothetical protein
MTSLLAEWDPSAYLLDSTANMSVEWVRQRIGLTVRTLRVAHRDTPIVLMKHPWFQQPPCVNGKRRSWTIANAALRKVYKGLLAPAWTGLRYVQPDDLFGPDGEATVDGIPATDVGFLRIARALEPVLRRLV